MSGGGGVEQQQQRQHSLQVIFPLTSLFTSNSGGDNSDESLLLLETIGSLVLEDTPLHTRPLFLQQPRQEDNNNNMDSGGGASSSSKRARAAAATSSPSSSSPSSSSTMLSARNGFQEMRALGSEITIHSLLSTGESVGDFLLRQWLTKERQKRGGGASEAS